ncbi:MAG TPA: DUF6221 family protein [Streptomyces sp.]|nr:DUF6221 family protein [Streptomyces sp.]
MEDLVEWLRAQLDDDERAASAATPGPWVTNGIAVWRRPDDSWDFRSEMDRNRNQVPFVMVNPGQTVEWLNAEHVACWDPKRALDEVHAKRRIIDEAVRLARYDGEFQFLELLALPYADRPGYDERWRPTTS